MNPVFVFGSNMAGRHGGGAAKYARENYGAKTGLPTGLQGPGSKGWCYAIPTKDIEIKNTLPLSLIGAYVKVFINYAKRNPHMTFQLTPIGCGLAGLDPKDVAPMFKDAPKNVLLPDPSYDEISKEFTEVLLNAREPE